MRWTVQKIFCIKNVWILKCILRIIFICIKIYFIFIIIKCFLKRYCFKGSEETDYREIKSKLQFCIIFNEKYD